MAWEAEVFHSVTQIETRRKALRGTISSAAPNPERIHAHLCLASENKIELGVDVQRKLSESQSHYHSIDNNYP